VDLVIATEEAHTLQEFVAEAFLRVGLDWSRYVDVSKDLYRPSEIVHSRGCAQMARECLGWSATLNMAQMVGKMMNDEA
jgi:GDPmannose 4,6-dehydratase